MKKRKKLFFIINPRAGLKKHRDLIDDAIGVFESHGYKVGVKYTRRRAHATEIAKEYGEKVDIVVCMGGDGTLNEVIQGMIDADCKTPVGYIPAGSTNDFATSLGLSKIPKEAAEFIMTHEAKKLDMGSFNGRFFAYTASAGIFTRASYETPQKLKNKLGHLAYIMSGSREIFAPKSPLHMKIELDGQTYEGKYIFAAINNATKVGGIMKISEDLVEFNDGVFELMLMQYPDDPVAFGKLAYKVANQQFNGRITLAQISKCKITLDKAVDWSLDGEKEKGKKEVEFHVIPDAVNFIY